MATRGTPGPELQAKRVRDLTLMLLYLTRWTDPKAKDLPAELRVGSRSWKGYDWNALDSLKAEGLIDFSYRGKSVVLSEMGEKLAREMVEKMPDFSHAGRVRSSGRRTAL
jgi:Mn-dependent DtxR family transcriptional regulator